MLAPQLLKRRSQGFVNGRIGQDVYPDSVSADVEREVFLLLAGLAETPAFHDRRSRLCRLYGSINKRTRLKQGFCSCSLWLTSGHDYAQCASSPRMA